MEKAQKKRDSEICNEGVPEIVYRDSGSKESQSAEMGMSDHSKSGSVEVEIQPPLKEIEAPLPAFTGDIMVQISEMQIECSTSNAENDGDQKPDKSY